MLHSITLSFLLIVSSYSLSYTQSVIDSLELELSQLISESEIPGLGVSIVGENGTLYAGGFGFKDKQANLPYDALTTQSVASISKTMIGIALMKLVEQGKVELVQDINTYLPFKVINPHFPETPITLLQLATHTSSIFETDEADDHSYVVIDKDAPRSLFPKGYYKYYKKYCKNEDQLIGDYLASHLSQKGEDYQKNIFGAYKPGEKYSYSNVGASLAAYIIELMSGQSFEQFTQKYIFDPLEMENTQWRKSKNANQSKLHFSNAAIVPAYSLITWPSGGMHTNSEDMGKFMLEILNGFSGKGRLLNPDSYQYMLTNRIAGTSSKVRQGIFWDINVEGNIGHGGAELGTACQLIFSPRLNKAFFMMINMSVYDVTPLEGDYVNILILLSKYAKKLE